MVARPYRPFKFLRQKVAGHLSAGLARIAVGFSRTHPGNKTSCRSARLLERRPRRGFEVGIQPLGSLAGIKGFRSRPREPLWHRRRWPFWSTRAARQTLVLPADSVHMTMSARRSTERWALCGILFWIAVASERITARAYGETTARRGWKAHRSTASPAGRCRCPRPPWGAGHVPAPRHNRHRRTWLRCRRHLSV